MPLLSFGAYSARVAGAEGKFVRSEPVPFFYLPLNLTTWLAIIAVLLLGIRYYPRLDRGQGASKYWTLLPGAVGVGIVCLVDDEYLLFGFPLQVFTLSLLLWRWRRLHNALWASALTLVATVGIVLLNFFCVPTLRDDSFITIIPHGVIIGGICAWPLLVLRIMIRKGVTWRRLLVGVLVGMAVPLAGLIFYMINLGVPSDAYWDIVGFVSLAALPFVVYVRLNSWARAVATGRMFLPAQSTSCPSTAQAEPSSP